MSNYTELTIKIIAALTSECDEISKNLESKINKVSRNALKKIKSDSPRRTGVYAGAWKIKKSKSDNGLINVTLYNSKKGSITHLLEKGHAKRGGTGRVEGISHIAPVQEFAEKELSKELKDL